MTLTNAATLPIDRTATRDSRVSLLRAHQEGVREGDLPLPPPRPQIRVADVSAGAELWGYVERVTNMGAYVNVGAEVPGFLLLKEIPGRPKVRRGANEQDMLWYRRLEG